MQSPRSGLLLAIFFAIAGILSAEEKHRPWSFEPLVKTESLPAVQNTTWPKSRIDYFVLAALEEKGLSPAPRADSRALLRRLHFDLTGLPPAPQDLENFDFNHVDVTINTLLESPHYGERWARHWLDLVRYTDVTASWLESTAGSWRYRDWVVAALNDDLSYPEFVKRQLATDLMSSTGPDDRVALGFLGLSPTYWKELQLPPEIIKTTVADEWEERVDAVGRTFLGLTLACARCHDHKTDPITTADYYALAGVFASVKISDLPTMTDEFWLPVEQARKEVAELEKQKADFLKKKPQPDDFEAQKTAFEARIAAIKEKTPHYDMAMASGVVEAALYVEKKDKGHGTQLDYKSGAARDLAIQKRGNPNDTGDIVPRRFLSAFPGENGEIRPFKTGSGRLELAESLIHDAEPIFARVIVNRIWKQHFGRGLVTTPSDFGFTGDLPTHRDLLDDLAARFIENGWSFKWLHREILNSATWQQTSIAPESELYDPDNQFYSRMTRRRLEIEPWRDAMLVVSGELDPHCGGESSSLDNIKNVRRTLYGIIHRHEMDKMLQVHDFPDPASHSPGREETVSPLQMLFALNGPLIQARAESLTKRIESEGGATEQHINLIYQYLFQRCPTGSETSLATEFLKEETLSDFARVLLASNEFLYID